MSVENEKTSRGDEEASLPFIEHPVEEAKPAPGIGIPPAFYVMLVSRQHTFQFYADLLYSAWISFSSLVILFNKWILDTLNFRTLRAPPLRNE